MSSSLLSPTGFLLAAGFLLWLSCSSEFSFLWLFLPHAFSSPCRCLLNVLPPPFCPHPPPAHFLYGTHPQACATVSHFLTGFIAKAVTGDRCWHWTSQSSFPRWSSSFPWLMRKDSGLEVPRRQLLIISKRQARQGLPQYEDDFLDNVQSSKGIGHPLKSSLRILTQRRKYFARANNPKKVKG